MQYKRDSARESLFIILVVLAQAKTNTLASDPLKPRPALIRDYNWQRITAMRSDRVIALYAKGDSTREVGKKTAVSRTTVLRILKDAGVEIRSRGGRRI